VCVQLLGFGQLRREPPTFVFLLDRVIPNEQVTRLVIEGRFPRGVRIESTAEAIFVWGPRVLTTLEQARHLPSVERKPSR
jgi:hypothetical protein